MTLNEYQEAALRTYKPNRERNHLLGLIGEAGEVCELVKKALYHGKDIEATVYASELGDCMWYASAVAKDHGWLLQDLPHIFVVATIEELAMALAIRAARFASGTAAVRGPDTEDGLQRALGGYIGVVTVLAHSLSLDMEQVLQANVDKLQRRYPEGFVKGGGIRQPVELPDVGADVPGGGAI